MPLVHDGDAMLLIHDGEGSTVVGAHVGPDFILDHLIELYSGSVLFDVCGYLESHS